jgi:hypothetical protein
MSNGLEGFSFSSLIYRWVCVFFFKKKNPSIGCLLVGLKITLYDQDTDVSVEGCTSKNTTFFICLLLFFLI